MIRQASSEEVERYDRQMRIWGEKDQLLIINAVVYIDYLSDLSSEVIKNLILKGVGTVVIGLIPSDGRHLLHYFNRNNVFHLLNGHNCVTSMKQLNPHVNVIVSDDSLEVESKYLEVTSIFVYHSATEASRHQKVLFPSHDHIHLRCFCISAFGDLGFISRLEKNIKAESSSALHTLAREIEVVESISRDIVAKSLEDSVSLQETMNVTLPDYTKILSSALALFDNIGHDLPATRLGFLADCILASFKTLYVQAIHEKRSGCQKVNFFDIDENIPDVTVSMGVELCSVLGGTISQAIIDSIRSSKESSIETNVCMKAIIDASDRCESVIVNR